MPNPIQSASERYRVYQFLPYLEQEGYACTVRPFAVKALHRAIQSERIGPKLFYVPLCYARRMFELAAISKYDAIVVHRGVFPFPWPALEKRVLRSGPKVIFDFDDAIHVGHRDTVHAKYPWIYKFKYGPAINEILRDSFHVIAGNRTLAEHARRFNSNVSVIPTVIDINQYSYRPLSRRKNVITIGWVGSRSTSPYLLEIEPALRRISEKHHGKIRFRLYGHPQRQLNLPNFESFRFSLESEIDDLRTIDIGIMPIPDNDWTRGKCAFKAIQYMALGIPTVISPVGMATEVVEHEVSGLWARTAEEWFEMLDRLVCDPELATRVATEGRKTIESHYSLQTWGPRLVGLLDEVLKGTESLASAEVMSARS